MDNIIEDGDITIIVVTTICHREMKKTGINNKTTN
jgi:hypothetical protein